MSTTLPFREGFLQEDCLAGSARIRLTGFPTNGLLGKSGEPDTQRQTTQAVESEVAGQDTQARN